MYRKNDSAKVDFSMVPQYAEWEVAKAFTYGKEKYSEFNYSELGMKYTRLMSACKRHLNKALRGEDIDPDSKQYKLYHLSCAIASLMMLLDGQINDTIIDNRNKQYNKNKCMKSKGKSKVKVSKEMPKKAVVKKGKKK